MDLLYVPLKLLQYVLGHCQWNGGSISAEVPRYEEYATKRQMLYNPSNEMREIFRRIYNKESLAGIRSVLKLTSLVFICPNS
jgi:hypothetical protein